ncbi:hypothetical protein [Casimicrobium huifangae]|uniref:hypothetical protein n=1 Tax=Casimicrobium huifangae TaxID=2591109 RepID=UPI0037836ED8
MADKRNREQGYDYISADQVLARGGNAIATAGFAIMPAISDVLLTFTERPNKSPRIDARVEFIMRVTDGSESIEDAWIGFGSDYTNSVDKAVYKAITSGHKYYLMKLLNIGAGNEDGEHDEPDAEPVRRVAAQPSAPQVTNEKLAEARKRYDMLAADAFAHGISAEPVEVYQTYEDLVVAGKQLKAALDKKTIKNGAH